MSQSTHQVAIKGVDKTAGAFNSISARAKATGAQIRSIMGGAIAAAGAYLSFRSVKSGIDELGNLSDIAMKAGTSVDTLTKASLAFQVAGLNLPVETLARSFQYLKKQTGEGGMDNFYKVAESIAAIEDPAQRGEALIKNFGRAGLELQPIVEGGAEAVQQMRTLSEVMPGVSQASADAGDEAADSMKILGDGMHSLFLDVIGNIVGMFAEDLPGGMRAGALSAANWLQTFAKKAKAVLTYVGAVIGSNVGLLMNGFMPAIKLVGASIVKVFSTVWESLKYVGTSIKAVMSLAVDAMTDGPKAAWEAFKTTMSEANGKFATKFFDTSDIKEQADQLKMAGEIWADSMREAKKEMDDSLGAANQNREDYLAKLRTLNVNTLANALGDQSGARTAGETFGAAAAKRIQNALTLAGSNQERRIALLGPEYQNEAKKQTEFLKQIAKNTDRTATNTEGGDDYPSTDL